MVKSSNQRKTLQKTSKKKRFSKRIKFIRPFPKRKETISSDSKTIITTSTNANDFKFSTFSAKTENDACLDLSLINWSYIFLKQIPISEEFIRNFLSIVKNLSLKKNEFVAWTLYIEYCIKNISNINDIFDSETLYYIGLFSKEALGTKVNQEYTQLINNKKISKIKSILEKKNLSFIELNQKYNYFCKYTQKKNDSYLDINSMIDFICDNTTEKGQKNKKKETKDNEIDISKNTNAINNMEDVYTNHIIDNRPCILDNDLIIEENHNDWKQEDNTLNGVIEDIHCYGEEGLVKEDFVEKMDSSYEDIGMKVNSLFFIKNK